MAWLNFPVALTEEEEMLKQALARLKKKKKMLQSFKAAANNPEKETVHSKNPGKQAPAPPTGSAGKATEQAKKLVQSGAIKVAELKKSGFKRSKNLEKKLKDTSTNEKSATPIGFQPFNAFSGDDEDQAPASKRVKGLSDSFVSAGYNNRDSGRDRGERDLNSDSRRDREFNIDKRDREFNDRREREFNDRPEREYREPPKRGNTIYVHGMGMTEELIKKTFKHFGNILNVSMETDRHNAFITFEKMDSADKAISEANGTLVNNIQLRVQMARRQRSLESIKEAGSSTSSWSSIAASNSQKGGQRENKGQRKLMTYDAGDIF